MVERKKSRGGLSRSRSAKRHTEKPYPGRPCNNGRDKDRRSDADELQNGSRSGIGAETKMTAQTENGLPILPTEIILEILSYAMDVEMQQHSGCALDLLVPDWHICRRENPKLERILETTKVVTYQRGPDDDKDDGRNGGGGGGGGTDTAAAASTWKLVSQTFGHDEADHIHVPLKHHDAGLASLCKPFRYEVAGLYLQQGAQVFEHHETPALPEDFGTPAFDIEAYYPLRCPRAVDMLPFDDESEDTPKREMPDGGRGAEVYSRIKHLVFRSPLRLFDVNARRMAGLEEPDDDNNDNNENDNENDNENVTPSPGTMNQRSSLEKLDMAIALDRASHLWISWSKMPRLRSVLLDLRVYSHDVNTQEGCLSKRDVKEQALEMARHLRLDLLVIAGLSSYSMFRAESRAAVGEDELVFGEPNWFRCFRGAVRPGGRLVFVDKIMDVTPSLPYWGIPMA